MKFISSLFGVLITLTILVFAISNRMSVDLAFWPFETTVSIPVYLILIGSFLLGFFFCLIVMMLQLFSMSRKIYALKRRNKNLEAEIFAEKQKRFQDLDIPNDDPSPKKISLIAGK